MICFTAKRQSMGGVFFGGGLDFWILTVFVGLGIDGEMDLETD